MAMRRRRPGDRVVCASLWSGLLFLGLSGAACATRSQQAGPQRALSELATALGNGDSKAAYALMSDAYREQHTLADFQKQIKANPGEARQLAAALTHPLKTRRYADIELSGGERITLENRAGRWLFATPVLDFYSQSTPRKALQSFVRAVEAQRWDVVLGLMPDAERGDLTAQTLGKNLLSQSEELERLVALLKASLDSPIEEVADRATMPYGESFTARLVREYGRWKIEDPE
jgi:hypothetical protein